MNAMYGSPEQIDPIYTACFRFDSPETGQITLEVELSKHIGGEYEVTRNQWLKKDSTQAASPLDLNVIQLDG